MSIQSAFNSMLGSAQGMAALYAFSPSTQTKEQVKKLEKETELTKTQGQYSVGNMAIKIDEMYNLAEEIGRIQNDTSIPAEERLEIVNKKNEDMTKLYEELKYVGEQFAHATKGTSQRYEQLYLQTGDEEYLKKANQGADKELSTGRWLLRGIESDYVGYQQTIEKYRKNTENYLNQKNGLQERKEILKNKPNKKKGGKR